MAEPKIVTGDGRKVRVESNRKGVIYVELQRNAGSYFDRANATALRDELTRVLGEG